MTAALEWLTAAKSLWDPGLRSAVDRLDPHMRTVVGYHFGWNNPDGSPCDGSAGKGLRPGLALLTAAALGGDHAGEPAAPSAANPANPALPGAVAVELVHNFSLVHDDLIDRDEARHHRPTVWTAWDDTTAILSGDAMLSLAHEELALSGSPYAHQASLALSAATRELIRGQAEDVIFESRDHVTVAECLGMVAGKTGSLLAVSASIGATLAGASAEAVIGCHTFGFELGLAFQIVDDLLGIWGSTAQTGKPVFADLAAAKKTLPVVWSFGEGGDAGEELREWFAGRSARAAADVAELQYAADLIEKAGGRDWAAEQADAHIRAALAAVESIGMTDDGRETLTDLAHFVIRRKS